MDHSSALGHTCNAVDCGRARESEALGAELREGISGADGLRSIEPGFMGGAHNLESLRDSVEDLLNWKSCEHYNQRPI